MLPILLAFGPYPISATVTPIAYAAAENCPSGTLVELHERHELVDGVERTQGRLKYRTTVRIKPKTASCLIQAEEFNPNNFAVRFRSGAYVWFRNRDRPSAIVRSLAYTENGSAYDPAHEINKNKQCDKRAIDSTTFGPFASCVSLYGAGTGMYVRVAAAADRGDAPAILMHLPQSQIYTGITAGSWVHDIGGEIALIRATRRMETIIDVYTLVGA